MMNRDVRRTEPQQPLIGDAGKLSVALYRVDVRGDPTENCGRVTRAGADLQRTVPGPELERFGHQRDDVRL
jgi:hypothetical protein